MVFDFIEVDLLKKIIVAGQMPISDPFQSPGCSGQASLSPKLEVVIFCFSLMCFYSVVPEKFLRSFFPSLMYVCLFGCYREWNSEIDSIK